MRLLIITPAPVGSRTGNRITALRWARLLVRLGHRVAIANEYANQRCDALIALHAGKSAPSISRFHVAHPSRPLIVALTGTDVYGDIHTDEAARRSLALATRLVVLQPLAVAQLPEAVRPLARVVFQSVRPLPTLPRRREKAFDVVVAGHLRPVKAPFLTAEAARLLPASSRLRVWHIGSALSADMAERARREMAENPRYVWLGERSARQTLYLTARAHLLSLTSISEGGANVISEAVTVGTPVVSSRIDGSVGLLGEDYPGYFPVGDTAALAALLRRAETDADWLEGLRRHGERLRHLFTPEEETRRWAELLAEISAPPR
jgi:putative glycosyltransferase (TIGR04348 family)